MPEDPPRRPQRGATTPERFARMRGVFEAALARPVGERDAFAAGACAGDADLLWEVERMLAGDAEPSPLLDGRVTPADGLGGNRFEAGLLIAGRYRILDLLGAGGMGEVYKTLDVVLNQIVALKFLSPAHVSEASLVRFRNEVRIARQVSHPNVCRVYDLGVVEGLHFLSMEYIDGETLASLLRRIGRLPTDTALEFARRLCAGLTAAHERGVLHRDLKPANIMVDARGQIRITDFGLAAFVAEGRARDVRSGTPGYMSPEQKIGREVTVRSEIYSLGLVLHEMFTGTSWSRAAARPTTLPGELDPAVERILLRCLAEEPSIRPGSALRVAMALPGGDPIAAALAAGETPSPEMIAAWQEKEGLSPRAATWCFVGVALVLMVGLWLSQTTSFLARAPLPIPPDALADRAQQLLTAIGYPEEPRSQAYQFSCCDRDAIEALYHYPPARRMEILASHRPVIRSFRYHQHRNDSLGLDVIEADTLRSTDPGMIFGRFDPLGRLVRLEVRPWSRPAATTPPDWAILFSNAGLDRGRFVAAPPLSVPPMATDQRLAWTGTYQESRTEPVRVEAASWQGRPVFFEVQPFPEREVRTPAVNRVTAVALLALTVVPLIVGTFTAWRNLRQGRSDRRGAAVIASAAFILAAGGWVLGTGHVASRFESIVVLATAGVPVGIAVGVWLVYIALEPYVRRHWPDALVSWTRLCHGQFGNPVVASHVLVAIVAAETFGLIVRPGFTVLTGGFSVAQLGFTTLEGLFGQSLFIMVMGLPFAFVAAFLRQVVRRPLLGDLVVAAVFAIPAGFEAYGTGPLAVFLACCLFGAASLVWMRLLREFGFLTNLIVWLLQGVLLAWPLTATGWFASRSLAVHLIPLAVAAWALWVIRSTPRWTATESA